MQLKLLCSVGEKHYKLYVQNCEKEGIIPNIRAKPKGLEEAKRYVHLKQAFSNKINLHGSHNPIEDFLVKKPMNKAFSREGLLQHLIKLIVLGDHVSTCILSHSSTS